MELFRVLEKRMSPIYFGKNLQQPKLRKARLWISLMPSPEHISLAALSRPWLVRFLLLGRFPYPRLCLLSKMNYDFLIRGGDFKLLFFLRLLSYILKLKSHGCWRVFHCQKIPSILQIRYYLGESTVGISNRFCKQLCQAHIRIGSFLNMNSIFSTSNVSYYWI